jgi:hypothetical protein
MEERSFERIDIHRELKKITCIANVSETK